MHTIYISNLDALKEASKNFLEQFTKPTIIAFIGTMGAGKTTFIKALCHELGVVDTVNSPTFSIVNEYETASGSTIYHFDLYRMEQPEEVLDIGFEDYLYSSNWCFIEWPEIAEQYLPENTVKVSIEEIENSQRKLIINN